MLPLTSAYANFKKYSLRYDLERHTFSCSYAQRKKIVRDAGVTRILFDGSAFALRDYAAASFSTSQRDDASVLTLSYSGGPVSQPEMQIHFTLSDQGIRCAFGCRGDLDIHVAGTLLWGADMLRDTFAVNLNRQGPDLRCAHGPASSIVDNALFDRDTDMALEITGCYTTRIQFDWDKRAYGFRLNTEGSDYTKGFQLRVHERVYADKFNIPYKPVNPHTTFPDPPVGWMSWYAVQFDACEDTVLENTRWQACHLKDYGANTIWVDWEWYHSDFSGIGRPGIDIFHPDPGRYPHGLKYVAAEIKKAGMIPALWIGATNDSTENERIQAHPEMVLVTQPSWCGQHFLDLTHPLVLQEYLPLAFHQLLDWGYAALKWDCLPITLQMHDRFHDRMHDPSLSTEEAVMRAVEVARGVVGRDYYMLYCSGLNERDLNIAAAGFDAARIGGDIFRWEDFVSQCVGQVMKLYAFHNVVLLNDPDNVILRSKFNTYDQALSRLVFVSLLGLPVTLGDHLPDLPQDRVDLLRRGIPSLNTHPMDIRAAAHDHRVVKANLAINKPYGQWNVIDVFNLLPEEMEVAVDLYTDLHLPLDEGPYLVYDYWNREYLGEIARQFTVALRPHASRVFAVHKKLSRPQVISTSRHLTQGAVDILRLDWDAENRILTGLSKVIARDRYEIVVSIPEGLRIFTEGNATTLLDFKRVGRNVWAGSILPEQTGEVPWSVAFTADFPPAR